jgi:multiple sugar transport system ATP-binding protein
VEELAKVTIENLTKTYGKIIAVKDVTFELRDNEFFVLFGPAGAGKTTILNMIAGIGDPDKGKICFDGQNMNFIEPSKRNVAMVFENYALYPHLTIYDNIASSMRTKAHKQSQEVVDREVKRIASMLRLEELLDRKPSQVSNGQKQRAALGRALVRDPNIFLMDEPLAHLDAKLRNAMRKELKAMQDKLRTTTLYVTHDYGEAMSLGDRIAVIHQGEICQIGTAEELYYKPATEFVARMFGDSEINVIRTSLLCEEKGVKLSLPWGARSDYLPQQVAESLLASGKECVDIGLRSSAVRYKRSAQNGFVEGTVYTLEPLGNKVELTVKIKEEVIRLVVPVTETPDVDERIYLSFDVSEGIFFDCETKEYITCQEDMAGREGSC